MMRCTRFQPASPAPAVRLFSVAKPNLQPTWIPAHLALFAGLLLALLMASGCGQSTGEGTGSTSDASASAGQVKPASSAPKLTFYAASRLADQVSFGATPELVAELQQQGLDGWVNTQMALPLVLPETPAWVIDYNQKNKRAENNAYAYRHETFQRRALTGADQLRQRVAWSLMQFVPISQISPFAQVEHYHLLQRHAFGNYGDFLLELSMHPAMGAYLNNVLNRPTTTECPSCTPNENYARELLQLFSIGVVQLNPDGSTVRDGNGKARESYSQKDVEELARALTGWRFAPSATPLPDSNYANSAKPMVPEEWPPLHDRGAKTIMGTAFPAGKEAPEELRAVIAMLMAHPNTAPFVSLRLIQHLVTSNPSPAYLTRVATVFRNNGQGVAGDMKSVVRAVLTDTEARRGDDPGAVSTVGKLREPQLWFTGNLRGMGCTEPLRWVDADNSGVVTTGNQAPFEFPSVFGFYAPTDRAPGSNLLAPEQKLLNTQEFMFRMGNFAWQLADPNNPAYAQNNARCDLASLTNALTQSPKALIDLISTRWFRGAMPPTLRSTLQTMATTQKAWSTNSEGALVLLQFALSSPYYGAMK